MKDMTSNEAIQKTVKKLEKDAIFPYQSLRPTLAVIHRGEYEDDGAISYLKSLQKTGQYYGAIVNNYIANTPFEVARMINAASSNPAVHGIIIISDYGNMNRTLYNLIPARLDIDSLSAASLGNLIGNTSPIAYRNAPCTAVACMKIMEMLNEEEDFSEQRCLIIGRSIRVGRPLAEILTQKNMTVTLAHSKSNQNHISEAISYDYIVSAIGKPNYWNEDHRLYIKGYGDNCLIDVGMNYDENGKLCGDVDREWFDKKQNESTWYKNYITPVVGGVGRVTTTVLFAKLFENAAEFFKNSAGIFQEPLQIVPQPQEEQQPQIVIQE